MHGEKLSLLQRAMNAPLRKPLKEINNLSGLFAHHLVPFWGISEAMTVTVGGAGGKRRKLHLPIRSYSERLWLLGRHTARQHSASSDLSSRRTANTRKFNKNQHLDSNTRRFVKALFYASGFSLNKMTICLDLSFLSLKCARKHTHMRAHPPQRKLINGWTYTFWLIIFQAKQRAILVKYRTH